MNFLAVRPVVSDAPWPPQGFQQAPQGAQQMPLFYEPSLTSLQIRQANLEELKKNDKYWERRIKELQKDHEQIKEIMDCEYQKAVFIICFNNFALLVDVSFSLDKRSAWQ